MGSRASPECVGFRLLWSQPKSAITQPLPHGSAALRLRAVAREPRGLGGGERVVQLGGEWLLFYGIMSIMAAQLVPISGLWRGVGPHDSRQEYAHAMSSAKLLGVVPLKPARLLLLLCGLCCVVAAAASDATASATDASARDTEHSESSESDSAGDSAAHNPSKREAPSSGGEGDRSSQALSS